MSIDELEQRLAGLRKDKDRIDAGINLLLNQIEAEKSKTLEKQICPRRGSLGSVFNFPEEDYWQPRNGNLFCSYCGCLKTSEFIAWCHETQTGYIEPTDKSYKFYIHGHPNKEVLKFYTPHLQGFTNEDVDSLNADFKRLKVNDKLYYPPRIV